MAKPSEKYEKATEAAKMSFKKVKHVTLPQLKLKQGQEYILRIETPFELAKHRGEPQKDKDGRERQPPFIFQATDMSTGEMAHVIANAGLRAEIEDNYPGQTYVGKFFSIEAGEKRTAKNGNNFVPFNITEVIPE